MTEHESGWYLRQRVPDDQRISRTQESKPLLSRNAHWVNRHEFPETLCGRGLEIDYQSVSELHVPKCRECVKALEMGYGKP